jgi:hypothetical protein
MASQHLIIALAVLLFIGAGGASGATIYVDVANTSGTENGTSWSTAFNTIQEGVDASSANDTVLLRVRIPRMSLSTST